MTEKKDFYKKVFALVLPMALQNLINVGVMATDVVMLGKVGETSLSGASLGGQMYFVLSLIFFGVSSGACVLTSQYWGQKNHEAIEKIMGIAIKVTMICAIGFMVAALCFPEQIMRIYTNETEVIKEGVIYLRITSLTYPLVAFTMTYLNLIKSVEKVIISTICYACSLVLNATVNAVLIFGLFGVPALGIKGAAIGTLSARLLEVLIVIIYMKRFKEIKIRFAFIKRMDKELFRDFMKYSGPVILNELLWGLAYSANAAIMGRLGSSAVAANSVTHVARQLAMVIVFGVGNATAIMIGKVIGEGKKELAQTYATRFVWLSLGFGILGGGVIIIARPFIISAFAFQGLTATYLSAFLLIMSYYVIAHSVNVTWIVGIFRAGGDTKIGLIIDTVTMWCGSILLGAGAAFLFGAPVIVVYFLLLSDEIIKLPLCYFRYKKKLWLNHVTRS